MIDLAMTPLASVRIANEIADRASQEVAIRALAATIVGGCNNIPQDGPRLIAAWVRANILYTQETPGKEILQGPMGTLPWHLRVTNPPELTLSGAHSLGEVHQFRGAGTGDCDDLATLWAALCRAVGLRAFVVGMGRENALGFFHAIGMCNGTFYELSLDQTYGADKRPIIIERMPPRTRLVWWDCESEKYCGNGRSTPMGGTARMRFGRRMRRIRQRRSVVQQGMAGKGGGGVTVAGVQQAGDVAGQVLAGARAAGLPLDGSLFGDTAAASAIGGITADIASAAATFGSTTAIATAAGASAAAVPIIGWIVAACIFAGLASMRAGKAMKFRNRAVDYGNQYVHLRDVVCDIVSVPNELRPLLALRLDEAIPMACGTRDSFTGRKGKKLRHAQWLNVKPKAPWSWTNGGTERRNGVFEATRGVSNFNQKQASIMQAHRNCIEQLGRGLAVVNTRERKRALGLLFRQLLGPDSVTAFRGWIPEVTEQGEPPSQAVSSSMFGLTMTQGLTIAAVAVGGLVLAKVAS
jgi:hypothetical protein